MAEVGACKLCLAGGCVPAGRSQQRALIHCPACGLVFVPESHWVPVDAERTRYAHHDNVATNQGYVKFLDEVVDVVEGLVGPGARILDFGSGEHQVLAGLLRARGRECVAYDPLYGIGPDARLATYEAIVMCEVIEHLRDLRGEIARLGGALRPGGAIVVRTRCYPSLAEIPSWWYARDVTHINFFAPRTLDVASRLAGLVSRPTAAPDIVVWTPGG